MAPVLEAPEGLSLALEKLAQTTGEVYGLTCAFRGCRQVRLHDHQAALHLYRICQEALHNAIRHGKATRISIHLADRSDWIFLKIRDNGRGLPATLPGSTGMGLRVMKYRAVALGGDVVVKNRNTKGVEVLCTVPKRFC
jgi:signal transduction histidine kinase